jgi:hypothetical protein
MSDYIKLGLLISAAIFAATAICIYFSPLQTCIRTMKRTYPDMDRN